MTMNLEDLENEENLIGKLKIICSTRRYAENLGNLLVMRDISRSLTA